MTSKKSQYSNAVRISELNDACLFLDKERKRMKNHLAWLTLAYVGWAVGVLGALLYYKLRG